MTHKNIRSKSLPESTALDVKEWYAQIVERVSMSVLLELVSKVEPPGLGLKLTPDHTDRRIKEWRKALTDAAMRVGVDAGQHALGRLFSSGLASKLVELSRSHRGVVARRFVKNPKGRKRAPWSLKMENQVLGDRRFMKMLSQRPDTNESDEIIQRAVDLQIIDQATKTRDPDTVYFMDYETGDQIAGSKAEMRAAISRIKSRIARCKKS